MPERCVVLEEEIEWRTALVFRTARPHRKVVKIPGVSLSHHFVISRFDEPIHRELPDRLEHREPPVHSPDQARLCEPGQVVDRRLADRLGRLQSPTARKRPEAGEDALLVRPQKVVAPGDRRLQGPLALRGIGRPTREKTESPIQASQDLRAREQARAGRSQLDGEGQIVDAAADLGDRCVRFEMDDHRPCSGREQLDRLAALEWVNDSGAFGRETQRRPTRPEDPAIRAGGQESRHGWAEPCDLFQVVEHEENSAIADPCFEIGGSAEGPTNERPGRLRGRHRRQVREEDAIREWGREADGGLDRQAGLSGAARTGQRDDPVPPGLNEVDHLLDILFSADEGRGRGRHPDQALRPGRTEILIAELEEPDRIGKVLEVELTQIANGPGDELPCRVGDEDLPAVSRRAHPGPLVHPQTDVAPLLGWLDDGRVKTDPDADGPLDVAPLDRLGGRDGAVGVREHHEEGVALRIDLGAALRRDLLPHDRAMRSQERRIALASFAQQACRALDVAE
jgi:hypothetical protein